MKYLLIFALSTFLFSLKAFSQENDATFLHLKDLKIISSEKESISQFKSSASTYVLNSGDINRSGATNIPELLRLVNGVEVYRAGSSNWSVTTRGFARLYDNKTLVLIDGREVYSSVFSGTNWDLLDIVLSDIDRIEVIRGGSLTMWGNNGLNGIINIVTKKSQYTQRSHLGITYGSNERIGEYRYGGKIDNNLYYRIYGKQIHRSGLKSIDYLRGDRYNDSGDEWGMKKAGIRIDLQKNAKNEITILSDFHNGKQDQILYLPSLEDQQIHNTTYVNGFNTNLKWKYIYNNNIHSNYDIYFNRISRKSYLSSIDRKIFNFNNINNIRLSNKHKLKIGIGYRYLIEDFQDGKYDNITINQFNPNKEKNQLYNAFIQHNYSILPKKLDLIYGGKFQHHYLTGDHLLPSTQIRYTPNDYNTFWISFSKGVKNPNKLETNLRRVASYINSYDLYTYWAGTNYSNINPKEEKISSYEIGYRRRLFDKLEIDISGFYNEYSNVRTFEPNKLQFQAEVDYKARAIIDGINIDAKLLISKDWKINLGYTYQDMDILFNNDSRDTFSIYDDGTSPRHQIKIHSRFNITKKIDFDTSFYYIDSLEKVFIKSHKRFDIRIGYRPVKDLEISLSGQKLLSGDSRETTRPFYGTHNATYGNEFYSNIKLKF
jgi:iron complex outermembrane receptor protein